jgi:hypothetical protein|tara:strand:- start:3274 stop:3642 length:369 start_codon:yes stop_codon:yes gene_type:complete
MAMKKVWVFKFRESGDEDDVVVFDSKPSREQMDAVLLEHLDQLFFDNKTHPDQERARSNDDNFEYLYYEDLWEREVLSGSEDKKLPQWLQWKLAELYEMAKKIDPDTASVISMAEDTLRKSK